MDQKADTLGTCCSGMDALKCFELLRSMIPDDQNDAKLQMVCDKAYNRLKYEVTKGYGVPKKLNKGVKAWHRDFYTCGHCGASAAESHWEYCPKCGTRYLQNSYTKSLLQKSQFVPEEILREQTAEPREIHS